MTRFLAVSPAPAEGVGKPTKWMGGILGQQRVPAGDDTLWLMYSNTKVITACAVWLLVERGALSFSDRVADHVPGFENIGAYVGLFERPLFLGSLVAGYPEFIAVWFVLTPSMTLLFNVKLVTFVP